MNCLLVWFGLDFTLFQKRNFGSVWIGSIEWFIWR